MKTKKLFKIFLLLLFSINLSAQVPPYVPTNGLVGWWPFTGNANDLSGNGNNGINGGASLTTDRYSNNNSAYYFNGVSQIDIPGPISSASTGNNQATISTWFLIPTIHNINSYLVGYGNPNQQNGQIFAIGEYGSNGIFSTFYGGSYDAISNIAYPLNSWHNITVVKSTNGLLSFYLDAILIYSQTVSTPNIGNNSGRFGRAIWNSNEFFLGKLDDIGIWNRALSPAEITALYTGSVSCIAPLATITTQGNSSFCAGGSCTLNANAGNSYTYQWYNNGTIINGATNISYIGTQTGNYTVKVTDGLTSCFTTSQPQSLNVNPCGEVGINELSQLSAGIHEYNDFQLLSIFPNPSKTEINITTDLNYHSLFIVNTIGQVMLKKEKSNTLSVEGLSNGVYFIQLLDKENKVLANKKFIKE